MHDPESTCWTQIGAAARGETHEREWFVRTYAPVVRAYLQARWKQSPLAGQLDDAVQDVFVECFKQGGVLEQAATPEFESFGAYLNGVTRNVALRTERNRRTRREIPATTSIEPSADETRLSVVFDQAWALAIVRQAAERQQERAQARGERAVRRVELLTLRFHEGLPIRDIAKRWDADPTHLHREYARAREEFEEALREVIAFNRPGAKPATEREIETLLDLLG